MTFTEYVSRWPEVAGIFSKEAVYKGNFDKHLLITRGKRGTSEVDSAFLGEIESWRESLARNIALRNKDLGFREINFAVQRTIDRIIFLRICEDRGIEAYERLKSLTEHTGVYAGYACSSSEADERYNSRLFHFYPERDRPEEPDEVTLRLSVDDSVVIGIIRSLYYPDSPYEFSVLPADILGQVYEQFLGKIIRLTPGHQARVEDKPEVKKAGGVYYTPTYVVDYIVERTVGRLLKDRTVKDAASLKILDPACGSGSFLLGAYGCLLDWYLQQYERDGYERHRKVLYQGPGGTWQLTASERRRILLNSIFGVDIDPQAVEVTKLSLLLKVLEHETEQSLTAQLRMFHERALPDLGSNIRCGNSLVGQDFYEHRQMGFLDHEERYRINAFDWQSGFPEIMKRGGFDAVIGNPPYIFTREQITEAERRYFSARYEASWEKHNTFMLFMELMLRLLNKRAYGGFIVPNSWLTIESAQLLRALIVPRLELISDLNYTVFNRVSIEPSIFVVSGGESQGPVSVTRSASKESFASSQPYPADRTRWCAPLQRISFSDDADAIAIIDKILATSKTVGSTFDVRCGLQAYEKGKGTPRQTSDDVAGHVFDREERVNRHSYRYLQGRDVGRYKLEWSKMWLQYGPWLSQPRELEIFVRPRVLLREITSDGLQCLQATYVSETYLNNKSVLNILHPEDDPEELKCLLGILNSRLMSIFYKQRAVKGARRIFPKVVIKNLREFPYPLMSDVAERQGLSHLVEQMLELHVRLGDRKDPHTRTVLERQADALEKEIDRSVFEMYCLADDEVRRVLGSSE